MSSRRYAAIARAYDVLSGEWPVYGAGRRAGLALLGLRPGDTVLDLGCGTGLNFAGLLDAVGPSGRVIGVDRSPQMLAAARRRVSSARESRVRLVKADAETMHYADVLADAGGGAFDAVVATYALSVIDDWPAAWRAARAALRPGGRALIVDMRRPTGAARVLTPLALLACALGGSDIDASPWSVLDGAPDRAEVSVRGGHIVAVAATLP
ncbi:methyltransferase domain-containing protein [Glaciibacter flavus]|uniref:Methyltransferase domain-containing protein n=1 Tax=Orlajensenia flava TaxID=2565934 RepID=A0A4S4FTY8_9MICO|nr:methyltransferase domain-containing protein [Glaciibacter flavus]THG33894.1 methyltransferase domain-containing protein [Glaciibacter flavus]